MTLYELREEYKQLLTMLEDPDADTELIQDTLESLDFDIADKVEGYGIIIEQLESDIARLNAEADRMKKRRIVIENRKDRLREDLLKTMLQTAKKSVKTDHYTVTVKQTPYKLVVDDPFGVPEEYYEPQPAKLVADKLKQSVLEQFEKNGFIPPYAHLERSHTIQIK